MAVLHSLIKILRVRLRALIKLFIPIDIVNVNPVIMKTAMVR
jgi:hypothetical protein